MKNTTYLLSIAIIFFASCTSQPSKNINITTAEIYEHISILASDSLLGRYPGDAGGIMSAEYIHKQLSEYNLTPIAEQGYQSFKVVTNCETGKNNSFTINGDSIKIEEDFLPIAFSENTSATGKVAFVGYGFEIETESLKWNDYKDIDVSNKWLMILSEDPEPNNMMSEFIAFSNNRAKAILAKDKGAIGVLLVNGVNTSKKDIPQKLTYDQNISTSGIPVISITRNIANIILGSAGTIEKIEEDIITSKNSKSIDLDVEINATANVIQNRVEARNVVFELKATTPTDKYIVIGAHFDHLGMGGKGVSSRMPDTVAVHNGADDNASGVAGIIELAGYLSSKADTLTHNIIFIAFDAEEMGTLGSKYFVQNSPVPTENITAMINFDMIGRMKADTIGITIGGTGTAKEFDSLLNVHKPYFMTHFSTDGYGPSDHAPFYSNDIPVLFFTTGAHGDYHTPLDDIEKLDIEKETDILTYASKIVIDIAASDSALTFQSTGSGAKNSRRTRLKVTLGIIPDVAGVVQGGLGIDGVRKGGPAEKGGIIKGDKITAINGEAVTSIYDYMFRLSKLKPETTAIIEVERNGEKQVLLIQL